MDFIPWSKRSDSSNSPPPVKGPLIFPGVAVDAAEVSLFHQTLDGGISKRQLVSGQLLWTVQIPGAPLAVFKENVWLIERQTHQLRLLTLHAETGQIVHSSEWFDTPLSFPAQSTTVEVCWSGSLLGRKPMLLVRIDGSTSYSGGAYPGPEMEAQARKSISMLVKVNPGTGQVSLLETYQFDGGAQWGGQPQNYKQAAFPQNNIQAVGVDRNFFAASQIQAFDILQSARFSNYIVVHQKVKGDRFSPTLVFLRVFSGDLKRLLWQQWIASPPMDFQRC